MRTTAGNKDLELFGRSDVTAALTWFNAFNLSWRLHRFIKSCRNVKGMSWLAGWFRRALLLLLLLLLLLCRPFGHLHQQAENEVHVISYEAYVRTKKATSGCQRPFVRLRLRANVLLTLHLAFHWSDAERVCVLFFFCIEWPMLHFGPSETAPVAASLASDRQFDRTQMGPT